MKVQSRMDVVNQVVCGDNLEIMNTIDDEIFDLIYIDPPFFAQKRFRDFDDRWDDLGHYLMFMRPRCEEIYRLLKENGVFVLQIGDHASDYLKVMCDQIFGYENFFIKIIWRRGNPHFLGKMDSVFDTILVYTKGKDFTFNPQYRERTNKEVENSFPFYEEETRRRYKVSTIESMTNAYNKDVVMKLNGKEYTTDLGWKWSQKKIDKEWEKNPLRFGETTDKKIRVRWYEKKKVRLDNIWLDMVKTTSDPTDYSTQKPEKLLKRIISMFSNPKNLSNNSGDLVGDFFCGSGTSAVVSKKLRRRYFGCDVKKKAVEITKQRLSKIELSESLFDFM